MNFKYVAGAALAAMTLATTLPAAATDYDRGGGQQSYQRSDYQRPDNNDGRSDNRGAPQNSQRSDASDNRGGYDDRTGYDRGDWRRDDWGRGGTIMIESRDYRFSVDRGDRLYRTLIRDYGFRPGLTYHYTDRCNRAGCAVLVFDGYGRRPVDRIFAPRLGYGADWRAVGRPVTMHDWRDREDRYSRWNDR